MPLLHPPGPDLRPSELTYTDGYNSIVSKVRRTAGSGSSGVVVFAGVDVDGLLAARILASLFKQDDVPYRLVPIGGYSELEVKRDEALASDELHTLILLSLGSLLNLADYFDLPTGVNLHIIDAHRPWNLDNLFSIDIDVDEEGEGTGESRIWVWGDGDEGRLDSVKKSWEALEYEPSDDESDDSEESGDESAEEGEDEEGDEDEDDEDGEDRPNGRKRQREGSSRPAKRRRDDDDRPRRLPRALKDAHIERINRYYHSGTSYGMSVALTIYLLATDLERSDNDLLWFAVLAVTHQYVAQLVDREKYEMFHELLCDEAVRFNPEQAASTPNPDNRRISKSDELRFVLFRHWNLYESMLHSSYVAGRMGIWKETGRKRLQGLLAKMGYSLSQCRQSYMHMDIALKNDLPRKLDSIAPEYGLVELQYPSFVRAFGFQLSALSAADAVEGLEALLEAATGIRMEIEVDGGRGGGEWFGGSRTWSLGCENGASNGGTPDPEEGDDPERQVQKDKQWHIRNFWEAYDACENIETLRKSLALARSLHCAMIRQGTAILDKAVIRPLKTFRFAAVKEGPDLKLFCHPSPLSRLALWLVDATRERFVEHDARRGKQSTELPFVVACLNEEKRSFLVVGVTGALDFGDVRKNKFGLAFQQAAEESGVAAQHEMFDTSIVEVAEADLQGFIESLHLHSA